MPNETLDTLVGRVRQRIGLAADFHLIQDWINSAMADDLARRRLWTWRRKQGQFLFNAAYTTGTVSITRGETTATFAGATLAQSFVGRQLRIGGNSTRILTILSVDSATQVTVDAPWGTATQTAATYEIYNAFLAAPSDFDSFLVIPDVEHRFQIDWWSIDQSYLADRDAQRSSSGDLAWFCCLRDYSSDRQGIVGSVVQSRGTGNDPTSGGTYTGVADAVFTIEMTDADTFKWKKDNGSYTTGVDIDAGGSAQELQEGVTVSFPTGVVYTSGDIWVIQCRAAINAGVPRFEFWPHLKIDTSREFLYLSKPPELVDPGSVIPTYVRTGWLVEKALEQASAWRHPDNKYYDPTTRLTLLHANRAERIFREMEFEDQARDATDVLYDRYSGLPTLDSEYLAGTDLGFDEPNIL